MNAAGVRHHDLNVKNVLLAPATGGLDGVRARRGPRGVRPRDDARLRAANVARLLRSARKWRDERGATFDERELAALVAA